MIFGSVLKHFLYCTRYGGKRNVPAEEGLDGDFVGGVESDGVRAALLGGLIGKAQAGEALEVRRLKIQLSKRSHVEGKVALHALGIAHGVEDRQTHVRDGDLHQNAAV